MGISASRGGGAHSCSMEFFCYHRDRTSSTALRIAMVEQHWAYMDSYAAAMIARGPTFTSDGTLTGSVHILDLPDPSAARRFAFDEPGYQAGAYRDVMLRRWRNTLDRSMWDRADVKPERHRYLVVGFTPEPEVRAMPLPDGEDVIVGGHLLSDDASSVLGATLLTEADDPDTAGALLAQQGYFDVEVHQWRFGGRPAQ